MSRVMYLAIAGQLVPVAPAEADRILGRPLAGSVVGKVTKAALVLAEVTP